MKNIKTIFSLLKLYPEKNTFLKLILFLRWIFSPYQDLEKHIPNKCKIVDVGCGYGIFANYLSLIKTRTVLGLDISQERIQQANNSLRGRANIIFYQADISSSDIPACDLITTVDVLHHLPSSLQEDVIRKSFAALNNKGVILIKEVDVKPKYKYYYNFIVDFLTGFFNFTEGTSQHYRSSQGFKQLLVNFGFKDVEVIPIKKLDLAPHVIIKGVKYDEEN